MTRIESRLNQKTASLAQTNLNRRITFRRRLPWLGALLQFHFHKLHRFALAKPFSPKHSVCSVDRFNDSLCRPNDHTELPHRRKVVIPGNHDRAFSQDPRSRAMITNAVLLINEGATVCGLNIWGSPVTCDDDAFGYSKREERARLYASIHADTHILVTHGPPYGILDREPGSHRREGCTELRLAVMRLQPRLHVFGHVHAGYGVMPTKSTLFVNSALLGWTGDIENRPIVLDITSW